MSQDDDVTDDPMLRPASAAFWETARDKHEAKAAKAEAKAAKAIDKSADVTTRVADSNPRPTDSHTHLADVDPRPADSNTHLGDVDARAADGPPSPADPRPAESDPKPAQSDLAPAESEAEPAYGAARPADDLLPARASEHDLRAAVGASPIAEPRKRRPVIHDDRRPRSFKTIATFILIVAVGVATVIFFILGRTNADHFALKCEAERAVPQRGRTFPPWGYHALDGEAWHPLKIAPETRCQSRETDDIRALERWLLAMLLDEANAQLTAHDFARLDETEALLKQSLLLTRPAAIAEPETLAADRVAQHKEIERLLGDVTYWRAAARLRDAANALTDAGKQFDSAAAQHPRHVNDAATWATYVRKLADQLRVGPAGGPPVMLTIPSTSPAASPSAASPSAASPSAATATAAPAPADPTAAPTPAASTDGEPHPAAPGAAPPVDPDKPAPTTPPTTSPTAPAPAPSVPAGGVLL